MFEDKYLSMCKRTYAIKASKIQKNTKDKAYIEYLYSQLKRTERSKLLKLLVLELTNLQNKSKSDFELDWIKTRLDDLLANHNEPDEWANEVVRICGRFPKIFRSCTEALEILISKKVTSGLKKTDYQKNLERLQMIFKLSPIECEIITFLYLDKIDDSVDDYFSGRKLDLTNISKSLKYFCRFFEIKPDKLRELLSKDSVLIKAGIIHKQIHEETIRLSNSITAYLGGVSNHTIESDYVKEIDLNETLLLKDHNTNLEKNEAIKNLLSTDKGCNILLFGHPGTGKTEFAKSLAKETGKRIYFINQSDTDGEESLSYRKQAIIAAHNIIQGDDSIIVVDECDKIINIFDGMWKCDNDETNDRKAWVNDFLENAKHKIIWISNRIDGIDESTKRRFSFSVEFQPLSYAQRKKVWETQIQKQGIGFIDTNQIENFAKNLKVNSGGITLALKDVQGMESLKTKDQKLEVLTTILTQHQKFTLGVDTGILKKTSKYNLDIVNSDYPLENLLSYAGQFIKERAIFTNKGVYNLNLLLQGPPGTGKTEFVKHLAEITDRELLIKRASDIRSKWYGESVRNIAQCFKEAQENGSILFFDEADSFFGSREGGSEYHAEETNELLTQMENFQGVLICSTNFTQKLDQAAMRRFNYKVKFDYLTNSGKLQMFRTYFSEQCIDGLDESLSFGLERIAGLTPGDFKVVFQKNVFNEKKTTSEFIRELENEVSYKNAFAKKVGLS